MMWKGYEIEATKMGQNHPVFLTVGVTRIVGYSPAGYNHIRGESTTTHELFYM